MSSQWDAVVVGSGPNGLSAAVRLAQAGARVLVLEANNRPGGGMRSGELTLPGFTHDICSAVHPTGILSPFWRTLGLEDHGLEWVPSQISAAHPLDDGPAALLMRDIDATAASLGEDADRYRRFVRPFVERVPDLLEDALGPLSIPSHPVLLARFGMRAILPSTWLARWSFKTERGRALLAGCAAHSVLPLNFTFTSALALMFTLMTHESDWPVARGGSEAIARALVSLLESLGGEVRTNSRVTSVDDLPPARAYLFDVTPHQLGPILGDALPSSYRKRLDRYLYGPGVFKLDYALSESIPWTDSNVTEASTVHVGGTLAEINDAEGQTWRGKHPERPFVMVCQQSEVDSTRAPDGKQTGYAYCHVPHGSNVDMTEAIEAQIERFAPGFRDVVLERRAMGPADLLAHNPNYLGGAITGGAANWSQLFTRPVTRIDPYSTPNPRVWICSASTPPGGGVHGMCGFHAAESVLRRLDRLSAEPLR